MTERRPTDSGDGVAGRPLAGIRVCDLSQNLAGPFCTQILADLGAEVVKVEPPGGDLGRTWGPPFWGDDATLFLSANRGKRSLILDLGSEEGRQVLHRLASTCDVFVQAFRPGVAERLQIDEASIRDVRPDVIYLALSAYGQEGPLSAQPGYDPLMQAFAGIMSVTGQPGGPPTRVGGSVIDFGTGMWSAIAILAALRERDRTGRGTSLQTALMDTALAWVSYHMMGYLATGVVPTAMGTGLTSIVPYRAFETSDGHVMITAGNDAIFERLASALDAEELSLDERFRTNPDRVAHRQELDALVEERTRRFTSEELLDRMHRHRVPASPIRRMSEVVDDPQVAAAGMVPHAPHPSLPDYRDVSLPLRWDGARPRAAEAPPPAGAHSREILTDLGFGPGEVQRLVDTGTVEDGLSSD